MAEIDIVFNFHPSQWQVVNDPSRYQLLRAGRGFGKSHLIRKKAVRDCLLFPQKLVKSVMPVVSIISQHNTSLTQIHWNVLAHECRTVYAPVVKQIHTQERRIEFKGDRPNLIVRGLGTGRIGDNLRGLSFYRSYIDEAQDVSLISLMDDIIKPRMETPGSCILAIFTPKGYLNDTYKLAQRFKETGEGREFHFTSGDNPFRDVAELEALRLVMPAKKYQQEILAEYTSFDSQIFTEFGDKNIGKFDARTRYIATYLGIDHGAINPAIALLGLRERADGGLALDVLDRWANATGAAISVDEVIGHVQRFVMQARSLTGVTPYRIYVPDDRADIAVSLKASGVRNLQVVSRSKPSPVDRAEIMNWLFKNGALNVLLTGDVEMDERIVSEIRSYKRKMISGIILEQAEPGQQDHLVDAIAYAVGQICLKTDHRKRFVNDSVLNVLGNDADFV